MDTLIPLHSEPKLYGVLDILSAMELKYGKNIYL